MAITFTSGLEPIRHDPKSYRSMLESRRRAAEFLQGINAFVNPLETQITFPTGIFSLTLTTGGSGYTIQYGT